LKRFNATKNYKPDMRLLPVNFQWKLLLQKKSKLTDGLPVCKSKGGTYFKINSLFLKKGKQSDCVSISKLITKVYGNNGTISGLCSTF
jgi:hypothetical protein